jgi:octaprenyl-diphosphate synthase
LKNIFTALVLAACIVPSQSYAANDYPPARVVTEKIVEQVVSRSSRRAGIINFARVSGVSSELENALAAYGTHIGTAFQLVDDILDYSGDLEQTGKNLGDDLAEGKVTLPLIHVMRHASSTQKEMIRRAVSDGGVADFEPVMSAIRDCGALEYARTRADAESRLAVNALASVANSEYRNCLLELAGFAVSRNY